MSGFTTASFEAAVQELSTDQQGTVVRRLRDSVPRGAELRAASHVRQWDPAPPEVALDFVRRI